MNELEKVVSDEDQKEKYIDVMLDHFVTTGGSLQRMVIAISGLEGDWEGYFIRRFGLLNFLLEKAGKLLERIAISRVVSGFSWFFWIHSFGKKGYLGLGI